MTEADNEVAQKTRDSFERVDGNFELDQLFIKARDENLFPIFFLGSEMGSGYETLMVVSPNLAIRRRYSPLSPESPSKQPDYVNEKLNAIEAKNLLDKFQKEFESRLSMIKAAKSLLKE